MKKPAIQILLELLSHSSIKTQYRIGAILGFFASRIPNQLSTLTESNIRLSLGGLNREKQQSLKQDAIRHTCYSLTELAAVWCWPAEKILARIETKNVCDQFRDSGKGRIVIAPHLGSWELLNLWLASETRLWSLYKSPKNPAADRFILQARSRNGAQLAPTDASGLRKIIRGIKQGDTIMVLPDQRPRAGRAQVESRFFGRIAPTTPLVRNICRKVDCDAFIAVMYRQHAIGTFGLSIEPLAHDRLAADEQESAQYLNDEIEKRVKLHLAQYQWGYKRFERSEYLSL
ncbi:MAG: lysophospholipid acyltransferase family protein [Gammaproteobacteria bacterium]